MTPAPPSIVRDSDAGLLPLDRRQLLLALEAMRKALALSGPALELRLCGDATVERFNRSYLAGVGPTNILSFPSESPDMPGLLLLSCPACLREAALYGQDAAEHCLRLLAHGLVHLAGLDHGPEMDALCERALAAGLRALALPGSL